MQNQTIEILGRQDFLDRLRDSKLVAAEDLAPWTEANPNATGQELAIKLAGAGLLTVFQLDAVIANRATELQLGNYEVLDKLGAGGMGTVFKARHRRMKRVVALKVLSRQFCKDEAFVRRFQREVEMLARLSHPNIVMAFDADESPMGHFLVMELVNGKDLASAVEKQGTFPVADAVSCILQAARGLEYVHAQGMIHRDVKPANLLRDAAGVVKVTDLGLTRLASSQVSANSSVTQAGGILGTVDYMPPEQAIDSTTIDHRADIYSLGCTLYYLLVGKPPFSGETMMAVLWKHRDAPIPSLIDSRNDVPPALEDLFRRMLAKIAAARPQSMSEVVRELEALQTHSIEDCTHPAATMVVPTPQPTKLIPSVGTFAANEMHAQTVNLEGSTLPDAKKGLTVLLVEPSRTQAGIIRRYLNANDISDVITAGNGQEALNAVRSNRPDAVLCSMHLTDMTGIDLAKHVRAELKQPVAFVLISSESESKEAGALNKSGLVALLHKPFTPEQLMQALHIALPPKPAAQTSTKERGKLRVLIVDDSATSRLNIRNVLQTLSFTHFVNAVDGAEAVARVATDTFDLIVTDLNMPHMDGRGLIGYLKQHPTTASVPIIMVTTEKDPRKLDAVRQLGVTEICEKGFALEDVRKHLERLHL